VAEAVQRPGGGVQTGSISDEKRQRLLELVRGRTAARPTDLAEDEVMVWPTLVVVEALSAVIFLFLLLIASIAINPPLVEVANSTVTPNPSKAPWYFLGLQELLTMFHPMVAGVTIPGVGLIILIFAPYIDKNPSNKPEDRKSAAALMTVHLMFWAVLVIIGSFFRGPGFNFVMPWTEGLFFEL
jgi:menaquinol-cytochrome c reductase cytochrome b/c subunit